MKTFIKKSNVFRQIGQKLPFLFLLPVLFLTMVINTTAQEVVRTTPEWDGSQYIYICTGGTVTVYVDNTVIGSTYRLRQTSPTSVILGNIPGNGGTISFDMLTFNSPGTFTMLVLDIPDNNISVIFYINVTADPTAPTMNKDPNVTAVCAGTNVKATEATSGSGGVSGSTDKYEFSTNGGISWNSYNPGDNISTTGLSGTDIVQIRSYRSHPDGLGCMSTYNYAKWSVNALPIPTITGDIDVCSGAVKTYTTQSGMSNYIWTVQGGTGSSSSNSIDVTWGSAGSASVSVVYTDDSICTASPATIYPVTITDAPSPSGATLRSTLDGTTWQNLTGSLASGFTMYLYECSDYTYLNFNTFASSPVILANFMHPFYLDQTSLPSGWTTYWSNKGVVSGAGGWQGVMYEIITGNEPIFYIKYDGSTYKLIDGLQYQIGQGEQMLRISGDYPLGTYTYNGELYSTPGCFSTLSINMTFARGVLNFTQQKTYGTIQSAIDAATAGDVIQICAGTYTEDIIVNKPVKIKGQGKTITIIDGNVQLTASEHPTFRMELEDIGVITTTGSIVGDTYFAIWINSANGDIAPITLKNVKARGRVSGSFVYGTGLLISPNGYAIDDLLIEDCVIDDNYTHGIFAKNTTSSNTGSLTNMVMKNTTVNNNTAKPAGSGGDRMGMYLMIQKNTSPNILVNNITIENCSFNGHTSGSGKGIYAEAISNATFKNVTATGNQREGIDLNLKFRNDYQNIVFEDCNIYGNALAGGTSTYPNLHIKGRNDGGTYGPNPALITNLEIKGGTYNSNVTTNPGISLGNNISNIDFTNSISFTGTGGIGLVLYVSTTTPDVDLGNTSFAGTLAGYIVNSSAIKAEATAALFDGKTGATATLPENLAIEDKIYHAMDATTSGLVLWKAGNVCATINNLGIQRGVNIVPNSTVNVGPGTFNETVTVNKSLNLIGSGCDQTTWRGSAINNRSLEIVRNNTTPADVHVEITGFSFETENNQSIRGDWSTSYTEALTLDIHDNCFKHVNTRNPGNDFALYLDGANQTPRGTEGAIRVYDNLLDVVTGGFLFEYCRAVDVIDNIINTTYEGVTFNYYGNTGTCGEQLVDGNVFTHIPVSWAFAMNVWNGDGTYNVLPSIISNNLITNTGFSYALVCGVQSVSGQTNSLNMNGNAILSGTITLWGDYALPANLNAASNWWGTSSGNLIAPRLTSGINYSPWLVPDAGGNTYPWSVDDNDKYSPLGTSVIISSVEPDHIICGETSGSITVTFTGGTPDYVIDWGFASTTVSDNTPYTITGLSAGSYSITITDNNGSFNTANAEVKYLPVTNTSNVPNTYYATIQAAIDAATADDVIEVCAGVYDERILVFKSLTLKGASAGVSKFGYSIPSNYAYDANTETIIRPSDGLAGIVIDITAPAVTVDGFIVANENAATSGLRDLIALSNQIIDYTDVQIINNVVGPNQNTASPAANKGRGGIVVYGPSASKVNLAIKNNKIVDANGDGCGIMLLGPSVPDDYTGSLPGMGSTVSGTGNGWTGKYSGSIIEGNEIVGNHRTGIELAGGCDGGTDLTDYFRIINNKITLHGLDPNDVPNTNLKWGNGIMLIRTGTAKVDTEGRGASNVLISGNEITANEKNGIYIGPKSRNLEIVNNIIHNNGNAGTPYASWDGIRIDLYEAYHSGSVPVFDYLQNINVINNSIVGNGEYGINMIGVPEKGAVNATCNWWGDADYTDIYPMVSGPVVFVPYLLTSDISGTCGGGPAIPGNLTLTFNQASENILVEFDVTANELELKPIPNLNPLIPGELAQIVALYQALGLAIDEGTPEEIQAAALAVGDDVFTEYYYYTDEVNQTGKTYLKTINNNDLIKNKYWDKYLVGPSPADTRYPDWANSVTLLPIQTYRTNTNPGTFSVADGWLNSVLGRNLFVTVTFINNGSVNSITQSVAIPAGSIVNTRTGFGYPTIQAAINSSDTWNGDTITVDEGTYVESNILVNKSLTILGIGATREDVVIVPANEDGNKDNAFADNAQNGFVIAAHDVTLRNLTLNGQGNPLLTPEKNNYRIGIVTLDASQTGGGIWNNLHIDSVYVKNPYRRGISVFPNAISGTVIENSKVENVAFNHGMYVSGQCEVLNNTIIHAFQGIVTAHDATTPAGLIKINGNNLSDIGNSIGCWGYDSGTGTWAGQPRGIQFNNSYSAGRQVEIKNNDISDNGFEQFSGAVGIYTRLANEYSVVEGNEITLTSGVSWADPGSQAVGMLLGWSYNNGFIAKENIVNSTKYGIGIMVFGNGTEAKPLRIQENTLTSTNSLRNDEGDGTGIYIANQYLYASDKNPSYVIISDDNTINGYVKGIDVVKIPTSTQTLTVKILDNDASITGNEIGIDANFGDITITGNDIYQNGTGVRISGETNLLVCQNNFLRNNTGDGILITSDATGIINAVSNNYISDNGGYEINNARSAQLSATCNWLGTTDAALIAPKISAGVLYVPWLVDGTDASTDAGFQPSVSCVACDLTASAIATDASCSNKDDGTATVTPAAGTAPYTYLWSNAATTQFISVLTVGTYTVTVTDLAGCTATASAIVGVVPHVAGTDWFVNDLDLTGDVFTTNIGNDANPGTAACPLASVNYAISLASDDDIINVDAGLYGLSGLGGPAWEPVTVGKRITLNGAGSLLTLFDAGSPSGQCDVIAIRSSDVSISGISVTGGTYGIRIPGFGYTQDISNLNFEDVVVYEHTASGVVMDGSGNISDTDWEECQFIDNLGRGFYISPDKNVNNLTLTNCVGSYNMNSGFHCQGNLTNLTITGGEYNNNKGVTTPAAYGNGIWLEKTTNAIIDSVTASGNGITYPSRGFYASNVTSNITVKNSTFENQRYGVLLLTYLSLPPTISQPTNCTIENNIIKNCGDGIQDIYGSGNTFKYNNISDCYFNGIYISRSINNTIEYNTITGVRADAFDGWGLAINGNSAYPTADYNKVNFNEITDCDFGVYVGNGSDNNTFEYNLIAGNTTGIHINNSTNPPASINNSFHFNSIINNATLGLTNLTPNNADATCNWWGEENSYDVAALISGNVQFLPYLVVDNVNGASYIWDDSNDYSCEGTGPVMVYNDDPAGSGILVSSHMTIQGAINATTTLPDYYIMIDTGIFNEDVNVNKNGLKLKGAGIGQTIIRGTYSGNNGGSAACLFLNANNIFVEDMTVTRDYGTTLSEWNACTKNQGITFGQVKTGNTINRLRVVDQRNAVYVNNAQNFAVTNCVIEDSRTGIQMANNISGGTIMNNYFRNTFTHGLMINFDLGVVNGTDLVVKENSFYGNWYSEVYFNGSNTGTFDNAEFSCNWYGTDAPLTNATAAGEPGYTSQVPPQFGGTPPAPLTHAIRGTKAGLINLVPWLLDGTDATTDPGFQPQNPCDLTPPVMTCPADLTVQIHESSNPYNTGLASATDNSGGNVVITFTDAWVPGTIPGTGIITRTWKGTDPAGNSATCVQIITIIDTYTPAVTCPADINTVADNNLCTAVVNYDMPVVYDPGYNEGWDDSDYIAGDYAGWLKYDSNISSVNSGTGGIVSKSGSGHGVITEPVSGYTGVFSRLGGYTKAFCNGYRVSLDVYMDLSDTTVVNDTYGWDLSVASSKQDGTHLRDFIFHTASNASGQILVGASNNSNFTRRNDLASIYHHTISTTGWYTFEWNFIDNGSDALAVEMNLLDAGGNILWTDIKTNPADLISTIVGGNRYMWFTFIVPENLAVDNAEIERKTNVNADYASGDSFPVGSTEVTITSTDCAGNAENCSFDINVVDDQKPVIECVDDQIRNTDPNICTYTTVNTEFDLVSYSDNCQISTIINDYNNQNTLADAVFPLGITTVTWTVTDIHNNIETCSFEVEVKDTVAPVITLIGNATDTICLYETYTDAGASASDNCGDLTSQIQVNNPVNTSIVGQYIITYNVFDASSNAATQVTRTVEVISCGQAVSGTFKYLNNAQTKLSNITVELKQSGITKYDTLTDANGNFSFPYVVYGDYDVVSSTSKPSAGAVNSLDAGMVNAWGTGPYSIEKVRFMAGNVIPGIALNSADASRINNFFLNMSTSWQPQTIEKWSFWKTNDLVNVNFTTIPDYPTITVGTSDIVQDFYGMVTGDFNLSFVPGSSKSSGSVELFEGQAIAVAPNAEIILPVTVDANYYIGAFSLIMEFPSEIADIEGVYLNDNLQQPLPYQVFNNQLRIGWFDNSSVYVFAGQTLFSIKLKVRESAQDGQAISFTLVTDPLNELGNEYMDVILNAKLTIGTLKVTATGISEITNVSQLNFITYPNPADESITISYIIPAYGDVTIEVYDKLGRLVTVINDETRFAGEHTQYLDVRTWNTGVYTVTMKLKNQTGIITGVRKIIIQR